MNSRCTRPDCSITFAGSGKPFEAEHVSARDTSTSRFLPAVAAQGERDAAILDRQRHRLLRAHGTAAHDACLAGRGPGQLCQRACVARRRVAGNALRAVGTKRRSRPRHALARAAAPWSARVRGITRNCTRLPRARDGQSAASGCSTSDAGQRPAGSAWRRGRLVVLGGSGGSNTINAQVPFALYKAGAVLHDWQIVHQSGERNAAAVDCCIGSWALRPRLRRSSRTARIVALEPPGGQPGGRDDVGRTGCQRFAGSCCRFQSDRRPSAQERRRVCRGRRRAMDT